MGISTVPRWLPQEQNTALRTADPRAQGWDEVSWGLLGLPQAWPGPQALAGAPFRGVMSAHGASLELNVTVSGCRSLEHNGPLSPLCLHTQVFPPFRLIPRKVTLIIGATMQVGAKGHAPAPPPPAAVSPAWGFRRGCGECWGVGTLAPEGEVWASRGTG